MQEITHRAFKANDPLTPVEQQVLLLIARDKMNREIAAALSVSTETVKTHVTSILFKAQARSRSGAVTWGFRERYLHFEAEDGIVRLRFKPYNYGNRNARFAQDASEGRWAVTGGSP